MITNPFTDNEDDRCLDGHEALAARIIQLMGESSRRLLVFGRRRMGKTSVVQFVGRNAQQAFLYCDISKATDLNEVAKKLLSTAPQATSERLSRTVAMAYKYFPNVVMVAGRVFIGNEFRQDEGDLTLEGALNLLNDQAKEKGEVWTICLDEFQEVQALGGDRVEWRLRGAMQEHRNLNYIFVGPQHIVDLMTAPTAAFFKQLQLVEVGPRPFQVIAKWIEARAKLGGVTDFPYSEAIVKIAGPCEGDVLRLAKTVFDLTRVGVHDPDQVVAKALDLIALSELESSFRYQWHPLLATQRVMLRAIAGGHRPTAAGTLRKFGVTAASTAATAIEHLLKRQILVRDDRGVVFDSPFFRRWVEYHGEIG